MLKNTTIGDLVRDLKAINEVDIWLLSVDNEVKDLVHVLQVQQLDYGQRPDGSEFDNYSPVSINVYGKPDNPIKWKNSGYFYNHIKALVDANGIEITNEGTIDEITGQRIDLELKFNEEIIGLQQGSLSELIKVIREKYLQKLRKILLQG
jgi:hypothetical protein